MTQLSPPLEYQLHLRLATYEEFLQHLGSACEQFDQSSESVADRIESMHGHVRHICPRQIAPHFARMAAEARAGLRPDIASMPSLDDMKSKIECELHVLMDV